MKGIIEDPSVDGESAGFGCAVANRFGQLLDDEGADPFDIIRVAQVEKQKKKKEKKEEVKKPAAVAEKPVKKDSQKDRRVPVSAGVVDNSQPTKSLQGNKYPPRGGSATGEGGERRVAFRDRKNYDNDSSLGYSVERPSEQGERPYGRGRGGSRGRGMRGGGGFRSTDGFDQRGKREFERHSGSDRTGVRPEEKRGGSGPRNWGSMRDQMSGINDEAPVAEGEEATDAAETSTNVAPEGEGQAAEDAAVEMSLDEWKALQQQSRPKAAFNLRKADTSVFSDMVVHKAKKHHEQAEEGEEEEEDIALRRPANDITAQLKIDFGNLARPSRGTRGGSRGGRGRGSPAMRPETTSPQKPAAKARIPNQSVPNPDDPEDFPALA